MIVIRDLEKAERELLKVKHQVREKNYDTHFKRIIDEPYCYEVHLFPYDYHKIWIDACIPPTGTVLLDNAINYINHNLWFLEISRPDCLNGVQVQEYLRKLNEEKQPLKQSFVKLKENTDCFLLEKPQKGIISVTDGMHRLVAYGIASHLQEIHFPISVFLGTSKTSREIENI